MTMSGYHPEPSFYEPGAKIAISKLDRGPPLPPKATGRLKEDRITRACKQCRKRKVRCSGDLPRCANCATNESECVYEQARRDRLKEATQLNYVFLKLLQDLSTRVDESDQKKIQDALEQAEQDLVAQTPTQSVKSLHKRKASDPEDEVASEKHGEAHVTASVGSNDHLDYLSEDLLRSRESRETGYVGQNSEIQWLRSVQRQSENNDSDPRGQQYGPPGASRNAANKRSDALHERRQHTNPGSMGHTTDATFYLDSDNLKLDIVVDPYEMPDLETAEKLFNCYLDTVHGTFPLVPAYFEDQFRRYLRSIKSGKSFDVSDSWRAIMNLLFAIGEKYSQLINAPWAGDERAHLLYMTRANHLLGLKNTIMVISGPTLELIQATGALAFYFFVIGHVSRAWVMIGFSMRLALSLGLHLRNEDPSSDEKKRESLSRTWWCLHSIECLVSSITGRPPVIAFEDCTVSLPSDPNSSDPNSSDQSHSSRKPRLRLNRSSPKTTMASNPETSKVSEVRYFLLHLDATLVQQKALLSLYSPRTAAQSWVYVQDKITELLGDLEVWAKTALPANPSPLQNPDQQRTSDRERLLLTLSYWSTKILITRPCLCRIESRISNESDQSVEFNANTAKICVEAARELSKVFPDKPDPSYLYSAGPWWDVVHIIMQTISVLLLEMAYESKHIKGRESEDMICLKKMVRWLRSMGPNDAVADRGYQVIWKILKTCAPALQSKADEVLALDNEPLSQSRPPPAAQSDEHLQYGQWPTGGFTDNVSGHPMSLPAEDYSSQSMDSYMGYDMTNPYFTSEPAYMSSGFGNPFVTSFDQGVPLVNMQDLWRDVGPSNYMGLDQGGTSYLQSRQQQSQQQQQGYMQQSGQSRHEPQNAYWSMEHQNQG